MDYQLSSQDVTWDGYQLHDLMNGASREKLDTNVELDNYLTLLSRKRYRLTVFDYETLYTILHIDFSSLRPQSFEIREETCRIGFRSIPEKIVTQSWVDSTVVRMPPLREFTLRVKITSVEKAKPRIVEPEVP